MIDNESILSLADSIRTSGILQPIVVRRESGRYEIIAGERRWRAAQAAGLREVPVIVRDATDEQMIEFALIENIQREDLNAIDRARAYRQFCYRFDIRPEQVAERLGEDRSTVVNYLRLLDLPDDIAGQVKAGRLSMGHARCLLGIDDPSRQADLAKAVIGNDLSVRALEEIVRRERKRKKSQGPALAPAISPHLRDIQGRFEEAVKTKVRIHEGRKKGTGRIVIEFFSLDDFDRIASMLGVSLTE